MASYSTNLALTLLDTGEGAGTWGNTTNTNLGTLLEQAISGYATESLTAGTTLTLTIPNGTTGVARNMYLEFTGNGSTVIVPSNKKLYFVYNNCASGTISFNASGGTGITVPKGKKMALVSDGTNVVQAVDYVAGFGSDSANITTLTSTSATITNGIVTTLASTSATITSLTSTSATITNAVIDLLYVNNTTNISPGGTARVQAVSKVGDGAVSVMKMSNSSADAVSLFWNSATSGDNVFIGFATEGAYTARGSITYNRGAGQVAYNATSDRRAKTIYGPVTNSGQVIDALNVYEGKMNWGTEIYPMMIADEMQPVAPYSVTGQPNATNPDGSPKYQQVDYTALVPLLIAEIQSLRARVAALEASP